MSQIYSLNRQLPVIHRLSGSLLEMLVPEQSCAFVRVACWFACTLCHGNLGFRLPLSVKGIRLVINQSWMGIKHFGIRKKPFYFHLWGLDGFFGLAFDIILPFKVLKYEPALIILLWVVGRATHNSSSHMSTFQ